MREIELADFKLKIVPQILQVIRAKRGPFIFGTKSKADLQLHSLVSSFTEDQILRQILLPELA
jgi:hypothetical protein